MRQDVASEQDRDISWEQDWGVCCLGMRLRQGGIK